jgi:hypothetical protein
MMFSTYKITKLLQQAGELGPLPIGARLNIPYMGLRVFGFLQHECQA